MLSTLSVINVLCLKLLTIRMRTILFHFFVQAAKLRKRNRWRFSQLVSVLSFDIKMFSWFSWFLWSRRPQDHKNVGLLVVSWLSLQPRHSSGSRGSRGLLVQKTTRRPQECWSSRGLLVHKTTRRPQECWSSCDLFVESQTQAFFWFSWFSWSPGPQDHKKATRILVFLWPLG